MFRRRALLSLTLAVGAAVALLALAPVAQASGVLGSGIGPNIGPDLNPLPSVGELLNSVVNGLFGALLSALTPSFLKHADIHALEWLVALPNVADQSVWPTVAKLEEHMMWVAGALLPTTLIIATARDTALSLSFRASPSNALLRVVGAVFWLAMYRFSFRFGVAFVNTLTHTMLSWPIVERGLNRTVLVMFGGAAVFGAGGAFLGLLGLVALVFAICLFSLKVLILSVLAILYVCGPLFIALTPLPTLGYLARAWLLALVGVCLIPVGWCIVFSTAGAISLDVTNLGGGAHIGSRIVGAFAALVTFFIAFRWPLMVLGTVRNSFGGLGVSPGGMSSGGAGGATNGALAAKAQGARTRLQAAMLAGGRGIGLAAGQMGAPRGGLAGVAGRRARPPVAAAAASGAIAIGPPRARPRPTPGGERIAKVGDTLRATPGRMRDAWRSAAAPAAPASAGSGKGGAARGSQSGPERARRNQRGTVRSARAQASQRTATPPTGAGNPAQSANGARAAERRASKGRPASPASQPAQGRPTKPRDSRGGPRTTAKTQASAPAHPRAQGDSGAAANRPARAPSRPSAPAAPRQPSKPRANARPRKRRKP